MESLQIRFFEKGEVIARELDECSEVLFVYHGRYIVGYPHHLLPMDFISSFLFCDFWINSNFINFGSLSEITLCKWISSLTSGSIIGRLISAFIRPSSFFPTSSFSFISLGGLSFFWLYSMYIAGSIAITMNNMICEVTIFNKY